MRGWYYYELDSWKAMLQFLVQKFSQHGYYYVHVSEIPKAKESKWIQIDEKIIKKYDTRLSKDQRARRKKRGIANFVYARWEHILIIMHNDGQISEDIEMDDEFIDIRKTPLILKISDEVAFKMQFVQGKIQVTLTNETVRKVEARIEAAIMHSKSRKKTIRYYRMVNGFPAWSGIIKQKQQIAKFTVDKARVHQVKNVEMQHLFIRMKRTPVPFWKSKTRK